ncbi:MULTISPECIES: hypothetical protein [Pseudovibrio]|uniref:hypothetical protein n=1 Tax=Stappiaceae TaxID=2821832 RepID=UPI002365030B|nr:MULTISPECIES: hypothetical protein [Pseudovibrio]MDD7910431.1 hypothetical protein [Pseudovibrio exalbescens]MDX5594146.1 hypothetical protein [Pseudovibrio sp. SPO723]
MTDTNDKVPFMFDAKAITTREQAEEFCSRFDEALNTLVEVIDEETQMLKRGELSQLPDLTPRKTDAIESYMSGIRAASANAIALGNLAPEAIQEMRERHGRLRPLLQQNLTVVATARSVSDQIVETVAKAVGSQLQPQTYGSNATASRPNKTAKGLSVNQSL